MIVFMYTVLYRKHVKVDDSKPAELSSSQEDIEADKKKWENMILSEGEDDN